jgi:type I restriction enzyme S subunit
MTELPKGWREVALRDEAQIVSGATPKTNVAEYWGGDIAWLTPDDLSKNRNKVVASGARFITEAGYQSCSTRVVPKGSVLFTSRAPIGYVAIAGGDICTNQGFKSAIPSSGLNSEFLFYQLQFATPEIKSRASGTTFLEINAKGFSATPIVLPPLAEQERIVEILEEQFSRLDSTLANVRAVREKAQAFRRSLLYAAFGGVLTTKDKKFELKQLQELVVSRVDITDGPFGSNLKSSHYVAAGPRVVRLANIGSGIFVDAQAHITSEHFETLRKHEVIAGDVLVASLGEDIPRACIAPGFLGEAIVKADCIRIRPAPNVSPQYLAFALNSPQVRASALANIRGVTRPRINLGALRSTTIPIPDFGEQQRIVAILEEQFSRLDNVLEIAKRLEDRIASERRSLLHVAFVGELTAQWRATHV